MRLEAHTHVPVHTHTHTDKLTAAHMHSHTYSHANTATQPHTHPHPPTPTNTTDGLPNIRSHIITQIHTRSDTHAFSQISLFPFQTHTHTPLARYWAVAGPTWFMVAFCMIPVFYTAFNLLSSAPLNSNDVYTRRCQSFPARLLLLLLLYASISDYLWVCDGSPVRMYVLLLFLHRCKRTTGAGGTAFAHVQQLDSGHCGHPTHGGESMAVLLLSSACTPS
jgi:hypothetical protein